MRPDRSGFGDFDLNIYSSTWLEIGNLTVFITENVRTCKVSMYDYVEDSSTNDLYPNDIATDCPFSSEYENRYLDPYWGFDLGKDYLPTSFVTSYYGEHKIFNKWLLSKYSW